MNRNMILGHVYVWLDTTENVMFQAEFAGLKTSVRPIPGSGIEIDRETGDTHMCILPVYMSVTKYIRVDEKSNYGFIYRKSCRV